MADYYEIDFITVGEARSGDAITLRYEVNGNTFIHVVDGGFQDDGPHVMRHLRKYYGGSGVSHIVVTHPDGDHTGGLQTVIEECSVYTGGGLWMLRPWLYAAELLPSFARFTTVSGLEAALRKAYPSIAALEEIAERLGITIYEPFQGEAIGEFTVLAPTKARYLDLVVRSKKTPKEAAEEARLKILEALQARVAKVVRFIKAGWGDEKFSAEATSEENEMSVVQYANLCGVKILLTGDVGRDGLAEAADYAPFVGFQLPGINCFDVPHHGSRRNVSTELLDRWLGARLPQQLPKGDGLFNAYISANQNDDDHPRRAVVRGLVHRGADVSQTEGARGQWLRWPSINAPKRTNTKPARIADYPPEQEEN